MRYMNATLVAGGCLPCVCILHASFFNLYCWFVQAKFCSPNLDYPVSTVCSVTYLESAFACFSLNPQELKVAMR